MEEITISRKAHSALKGLLSEPNEGVETVQGQAKQGEQETDEKWSATIRKYQQVIGKLTEKADKLEEQNEEWAEKIDDLNRKFERMVRMNDTLYLILAECISDPELETGSRGAEQISAIKEEPKGTNIGEREGRGNGSMGDKGKTERNEIESHQRGRNEIKAIEEQGIGRVKKLRPEEMIT